MKAVTLTDQVITQATCPVGKQRAIYWDAELPRFGLVVAPSQTKSFAIQYRCAGHSRRMVLPIGVDRLIEARALARRLLKEVDNGGDPLMERRASDARAALLQKGRLTAQEALIAKVATMPIRRDALPKGRRA